MPHEVYSSEEQRQNNYKQSVWIVLVGYNIVHEGDGRLCAEQYAPLQVP